jgi:hypothetical protein
MIEHHKKSADLQTKANESQKTTIVPNPSQDSLGIGTPFNLCSLVAQFGINISRMIPFEQSVAPLQAKDSARATVARKKLTEKLTDCLFNSEN